ncbi:hypothetical protein FOZ63_021185 [Perkinsus olseni]|uniref:Tyr recombinase domain-containing protein n=1 Tax=Perkinsus olseni TaxID=32597 RepID=A0A7J6NA52_PEROL|nr:hypothetical protein FOZ60_013611 [Perkinsus olseni]KAF4757394.1 hypothetical protein FOZ63_021185 [Perkinsus olseni]
MESSGRKSVPIGRTLRADLALWRTHITELRVTLLGTADGARWAGASDASLGGLGGWARVRSPADGSATILYFHASLADIPPEWSRVIFPAHRVPEPADVAALELLASCLLVCMVVPRMSCSDKLVLFSDNSSCVRALERCFSSTPRGRTITDSPQSTGAFKGPLSLRRRRIRAYPRVSAQQRLSPQASAAVRYASAVSGNSLEAFVRSGHAWSTHSQYRSALNLYSAICASNGTPPVPVGARSLVLLVSSMARARYAFSTITKYCSQLALRAAERDVGSAVARAFTLTKDQVFRVTRALDVVDVGFGDGSLVGTMALLRVSEMLNIEAQHVEPFHTVVDSALITGITLKIPRSKCDQGAKGVWRPIPCTGPQAGVDDDPVACSSRFCAAHCLLRRAASAAAPVDRLFPFAYSTFNDNLKSAMARVLDLPQAGIRLSSHTMRRSGSAICCGSDNFATPTVAEFGRWASTESLENVYLRDNADAFNRFVVGLLATWSSCGA